MVEFVQSDHPIDIRSISLERRLRPLSEDAVVSLMDAIERVGFFTRVLLRKKDGVGYQLLDGAHRVEAMSRLGATDVPAVVVKCRDDYALYLESDANLNGADLTPLDMAVFLSARRRAHQEMNPETKQAEAGAAARWMQVNCSSLASSIAKARGVTVRQVLKQMAAGEALSEDEVARLREVERPLSLNDVITVGKITDAEARTEVINALAEGRAKSASQALSQLTAKPERDPADAAYEALLKAFARAPMAARRRFVAEHGDELAHMIAEARD